MNQSDSMSMAPKVPLQPRRLRIAPAAVGCKRLLGRRAAPLRDHHKSVGCSDHNTRVVCAEA